MPMFYSLLSELLSFWAEKGEFNKKLSISNPKGLILLHGTHFSYDTVPLMIPFYF